LKAILTGVFGMLVLATASFAQVPQAGHVVVVLEENHSYSAIYNSSSMPYLNGLAAKYGLATSSYGNTHPSIGNYLMMTTGQIITNSDGYTGTITANNMVRAMIAAGVTWKSYAESLPSAGYTGGDKYPYSKHHNPFAYFSDVVNSSSEKLNIVPFTQFATDVQNGTLPKFSFIVPNMNNNMHDCPAGMSSCTDSQKKANTDAWLKKNLSGLLASAEFQKDGLLVITFDEGSSSDTTNGGGRIFTTVIGPKVKSGFKSTAKYQHQNLLRTILAAIGVTTNVPGAASSATMMSDFFGTTTAPPPTTCTAGTTTMPAVTICTPTQNGTSGSPMRVTAAAASNSAISYSSIWIDGVKVYEVNSSRVDTPVVAAAGSRRVTVQAKDASGTVFKSTVYVTVQ
jgi:phosphatidylinositol-3-phosphatase